MQMEEKVMFVKVIYFEYVWPMVYMPLILSEIINFQIDIVFSYYPEINDLYTRIVIQAMKIDFEICFVTKQIEKELSIFLVTRTTRL